ncbi:MAG: putative porin [Paraglaciecola sp.]|jgi:predicted porin
MKNNIFSKNKFAMCLFATSGVLSLANPAIAGVNLLTSSDWETSISGSLPVFMVASDHDNSEKALRVQSGFNPANINFHVVAPKSDAGITVSGHFQIDTHLQGSGVQDSGLFESRVANIQLSGDFGTIVAGKDFGVFNSSAIGDLGSQRGVGWLGGGADTANATGGRIGTGYVYANFNPQVKYISPSMGGLSFKVALINPEEPQDASVETGSPRIEGQVNYKMDTGNGALELWSGVFQQSVDVMVGESTFGYDMQGIDVGAHIDLASFGLTVSYTDTTGIGADGLYGGSIHDADVDGTQWYVEADYVFGKNTIGVSYGEGSQDARAADSAKGLVAVGDVDNELTMLFVNHQMTPQFRLIGELQDYQSTVQNDYTAIVAGFQFDF